MAIGERIREARHKSGLSLAALARSTGLSKGFLSQVESGASTPSIGSLQKLAQALGVPLASMLEESAATQSPPHIEPGIRIVRAARVHSSLQPLVGRTGGSGAYFTLRPGESLAGQATPRAGATEAICLVVDGSLRLTSGRQSVTVMAGDLANFSLSVPHRLECTSREAQVLILLPEARDLPRVETVPMVMPIVAAEVARPTGPFRLVEMRAARSRARRAG